MNMMYLLAGLVVFLGAHSTSIMAPAWRDAMLVRLGEQRWKATIGLVSIAGFVLLVWGYGQARLDPVVLYVPPTWLRHLALLLMVPVFPLLLAAYLPGRIKAAARHPMLAAVKLWALAHLLANGTAADLLLFGGLLAWAVVDRISVGRRPLPPVRSAPPSRFNDVIVVLAGLVLYGVFVGWAHLWLIGVPPIAR
jgi:uncharacterized membrane protein